MASSISGLPSGLESLALQDSKPKDPSKLNQDAFLELMITQLKNQDPMKPMESGEFLGQLAQFGTVNGINDLTSSFQMLASSLQSNQALQASTMVGRSVLVAGDRAPVANGSVFAGAIELPQESGAVSITVQDAAGQTVKHLSLGAQESGMVQFTWDGIDDAGAAVRPGMYRVRAEAAVDGENVAVPTLLRTKVDSVTLLPGGGSPQLNLNGLGAFELDQIRQVM